MWGVRREQSLYFGDLTSHLSVLNQKHHYYFYPMPLLDIKRAISPAKKFWHYALGVFVLNAIFTPLMWNGPYDSFRFTAIALIWGYGIWLTQILGHTLLFQLLDKVFSWQKQPLLRGVVGVVSMVVYAGLAYISVQIIMELVFFQRWPEEDFWQQIAQSKVAILIATVFSTIATLIGFLNAWRKSEVEKERLKTEMLAYKYNALQNQVNPHFLFNSFNVLSELVYEDQALAVKFIQQMSDLYRYVLTTKNEDLVPLEKEIEFIKSYIFLLETRFQNQVIFEVDIEPNPEEYIVPMALQLLVENTVKHNQATTAKPLLVRIGRQGNAIVVHNNLQPKAVVAPSTQTGLQNLKERYAHLNSQIEVYQDVEVFRVKVPLLNVENA